MENKVICWKLKGSLDNNANWIVPIQKDHFSIGRDESKDLILPSSRVSRNHALLSIKRQELYIVDSGSKNGTYLNGSKIEGTTRLRGNDRILIGSYEFTIIHEVDNVIETEQTILEENDSTISDFAGNYGLSKREQDVLFFLIRGMKIPEIGEKLFISPGTAKLHTLNIYKKTNCHSRIELVNLYHNRD